MIAPESLKRSPPLEVLPSSIIHVRTSGCGTKGTRFYQWTFVAILAFLSGCGSGTGPQLGTVTGTITLNGEPAAGVHVTFIPEDSGSPSYGGTDEDGVYRLMFNQKRVGAELGRHKVVIQTPEPQTDDSGNLLQPLPSLKVPGKYQQPGVLTAEVSPGHNEVDFELDSRDSL